MNDQSLSAALVRRLQFGFGRKLRLQQQTEAAECGLACLAMLASYHGHDVDVATLRSRFALSLKGATLQQLIEIAHALKLIPRPLKLELSEISQLQTPCVLHWNLDHFVVVEKVAGSQLTIFDPGKGVRKYSIDEVSKHFTGVALELTPATTFEKKAERRKVRLRNLLGKVVGLKRSLLQVCLLAIVLEGLSLLAPLFNQWVVDQAIVSGDVDLLVTLAVGFAVLKIIGVAIEGLRSWAVLMLSMTMNVQWLANLFRHLVGLPISYFEKRHMGDVMSRFNSIHTIQSTLTTSFVGAILDGLMAVGTVTMMLIYSPTLTVLVLVAIGMYVALRSALYGSLMAATDSVIVQDARQQSIFMETLRGIQSLRLFSKEKERAATWLNVVVKQKNAELGTQRLMLMFQLGSSLLFGIEAILVFAVGAHMVISGAFSTGMLFAFVSYKSQFTARVSALVDKFFEFRMLSLHSARLADIALSDPEQSAPSSLMDVSKIAPVIEVRNLSFRYGAGEKPVFVNLSFKIEAGESVALVGPSGCGKTTLVKVLLGIHKPSGGEILIGGISLRELGVDNYRRMIGSVMQDDALFAGSISENIAFFDSAPDQGRVEACARMASLHNEISAMPMGYNSLIGDMGSALSGGQRQRLLLARALYVRPKFLFLDEATSNLDIENEKLVTDLVRKLPLTRIVVAHRKETIEGVDRVIDLRVLAEQSRRRGEPAAPDRTVERSLVTPEAAV